jgi:hypothetical protein
MKKILLLFWVMLIGSGCASGFSQFYDGESAEEIAANSDYRKCTRPELKNLPDKSYDELENDLYEQGYWIIGYSSFNGSMTEGPNNALEQGKALGACWVLYGQEYTGSSSGVIPITTPTTSTTTHTGTIYGSGGSGSYSGTSTTYGTRTTYMPYTVHRADYTAVYAVRIQPRGIGVMYTPLPDKYARQLDSKNGIFVVAVHPKGAASKANIFKEDIIISCNGQPTNFDDDRWWSYVTKGEKNTFEIIRDGQKITKEVYVPLGY